MLLYTGHMILVVLVVIITVFFLVVSCGPV